MGFVVVPGPDPGHMLFRHGRRGDGDGRFFGQPVPRFIPQRTESNTCRDGRAVRGMLRPAPVGTIQHA